MYRGLSQQLIRCRTLVFVVSEPSDNLDKRAVSITICKSFVEMCRSPLLLWMSCQCYSVPLTTVKTLHNAKHLKRLGWGAK